MRFTKIGKERGDCTCDYHVTEYRSLTVRDFVNEVLCTYPNEWGYISVGGSFVFHPHCEYRFGKLLSALSDDLLDKRIMCVDGDGGWSRMDYSLYVE